MMNLFQPKQLPNRTDFFETEYSGLLAMLEMLNRWKQTTHITLQMLVSTHTLKQMKHVLLSFSDTHSTFIFR